MKTIMLAALMLFGFANANAQKMKAVDIDYVLAYPHSEDTVYLVNYWATFCAPCMGEISELNALVERYANKPFKLLMVCLDPVENYPMKLDYFLERKKVSGELVWLKEQNAKLFVPKVDENWEGSIPACFLTRPGRYSKFIEGVISAGKVAKVVDELFAD